LFKVKTNLKGKKSVSFKSWINLIWTDDKVYLKQALGFHII
jgi:hypothetical protein